MSAPPWTDIPSIQLKTGHIATLTIGAIPVTFPSNKFCKNYVDDNFLNHIVDIVAAGQGDYGNGAVDIGFVANCGHKKLTGGDAIGYKWNQPGTALAITGYGEKSSGGKKAKNSGGYTWET
jgi:hypothetical protein